MTLQAFRSNEDSHAAGGVERHPGKAYIGMGIVLGQ